MDYAIKVKTKFEIVPIIKFHIKDLPGAVIRPSKFFFFSIVTEKYFKEEFTNY